MTVIELATFRAKDGHGDAMGAGLVEAAAVIAAADGCLGAVPMRCIERPDEFVFRIEWTEVERHLAFRDSPDFPRYRAPFADHLEEVVGFAHYNEL